MLTRRVHGCRACFNPVAPSTNRWGRGTWPRSPTPACAEAPQTTRGPQMARVVRGGGGADVSCARLQYMFRESNSFNQPLEAWDVGQVTTMQHMFQSESWVEDAFNQPLGAWNMAKVTATYVRRSPSNHTRATDGEGCAEVAGVRRC